MGHYELFLQEPREDTAPFDVLEEDSEKFLKVHGLTEIESDAKDLLLRMLCIDASNRITAKEALQHPYFICDK